MDDLKEIEEMDLSNILDIADQVDKVTYLFKGIRKFRHLEQDTNDTDKKHIYDWCGYVLQNHLEDCLDALTKKISEKIN